MLNYHNIYRKLPIIPLSNTLFKELVYLTPIYSIICVIINSVILYYIKVVYLHLN